MKGGDRFRPTTWGWGIRVLALGILALPGPLARSSGAVISVVSNADAGPGSLREALTSANAAGGGDIEIAALPGSIKVETPLPAFLRMEPVVRAGGAASLIIPDIWTWWNFASTTTGRRVGQEVAKGPAARAGQGRVAAVDGEVESHGTASGLTPSDLTGVDPKLGLLGEYGGVTPVLPILVGSDAVDRAEPMGIPATDQRGMSRPIGEGADLGAFELEETVPSQPRFTSMKVDPNGTAAFGIDGPVGGRFRVETSSDLRTWDRGKVVSTGDLVRRPVSEAPRYLRLRVEGSGASR